MVDSGLVCPKDLSSAIQTGALPLTYNFGVAFRLCACTGEWAKVLCPAASFAGVITPQTKDIRKRTWFNPDGNIRTAKGVCPLKFHRRKKEQ